MFKESIWLLWEKREVRWLIHGRDDDALHQGGGDGEEMKCIYIWKNATEIDLLVEV